MSFAALPPPSPNSPAVLPVRPTALAVAVQRACLSLLAAVALPTPWAWAAEPTAPAVSQAQPGGAARKSYAIAAGPLDLVLARFAAAAGMALSFDPALAAGRQSPGLQGRYGDEEGLRLLLEGSGLALEPRGGGYTLRRLPAGTAPAPKAELGKEEAALPVVTTLGSRAPGVALSSVPSSLSRVSEQTVLQDLSTGALIEDILARNVPGVHPSNVGARTIRGRTAQVFINGTPMNEQMRFGSGSDLNALSPDHFESIEVSRGANAAYGFGSPGGIIALATPQARTEKLSLNTRLRSSFNTGHPGGSFQTTLYQSASQIVGPFDYHVAFSAVRDGTSRTPGGEVSNIFTSPGLFMTGDEKIYNFDANLGYDLGSSGRLRLVTTGQSIDYVKYYGFEGGTYRGDHVTTSLVPDSGLSYRRARTAHLSYENDDVGGSALKIEAFSSRVYASRRDLNDAWFKDENIYTGIRSAITTPLHALQRGAALSYGLDAIRNEMDDPLYSSATGALTGRFAPPAQMTMWAPYAQLQWPLGKTRLSAGVRHERYSGRVDSTGNGSVTTADDGPGGSIRDFNITLFNGGLLHPLNARTDLHATYTQGAEISEVRRAGFAVNRPERVDPKAARSHQIETGLRYKGDDLRGSVTAFYTQSRLISATDCSKPNLPCVPLREPRKIWGLEFAGDWKISPQWQASGTFTWHDGRRKAEGGSEWSRVSSIDVAPVHGSVTLGYTPRAGWRNHLVVDWRGGRGRIGDDWPYGNVNATTLLHLTTAIDIGPGTLELGVHNLLNTTHYAVQAEAYNGGWVWLPEQGRRVSLGYRVRW